MLNIIQCTDTFCLYIGAITDCYNAKCFEQTGVDDTPEKRAEILTLHTSRHYLFQQMRETPADDFEMLAVYRTNLQELEFEMQAAWGFDQDENFHTYWFRAPHCTCPKMDNSDMFGSEMKYISGDCPLHGTNAIDVTFNSQDVLPAEAA